MENKTKIIINRKAEFLNRRRIFKVLIDGREEGTISTGTSEEFSVTPGTHTIQCKVDWCSSPPLTINLGTGEIAYLQVKNGLKFYWPLFILLLAGVVFRFLYLRNVDVRPSWANAAQWASVIPILLYLLYSFTLGRNNYLQLEKDKSNVFA